MSRSFAVGIFGATIAFSAGLVSLSAAGCSGKIAPTADASTSSSSSSTSSSSGASSSWGGSSSSSSSGTSGEPYQCGTTAPIDTSSYPWSSPRVMLGSCTEAELASFDKYISSNPSSDDSDWKTNAGLSPTCVACIFGPIDGVSPWAPLLESSGTLTDINVGGCMAIASGQDSCGKAFQHLFDCRNEACSDCADDQTYTKCLAQSAKAACSQAVTDVVNNCGPNAESYSAMCQTGDYIFDGPVRAQCIAGLTQDGG